jgi:hypothetical protein
MCGDILRDERRPDFPGLKGRVLLVNRADTATLLVIQHRKIYRPGEMIFRELGRGANIYNLIKMRFLRQRTNDVVDTSAHFSRLFEDPPKRTRAAPYMDERKGLRNDLSQNAVQNV